MSGRGIYLIVYIGLITCVTGQTPLDDYVRRPDPAYKYEYLGTVEDTEYNVDLHQINMTSLQWKDETFTNHPIWFHQMAIIVPKGPLRPSNTATLFISAGNRNNAINGPITPDSDFFIPMAMDVANQTKSIVAVLNQIPNQPIRFMSDPTGRNRSEDDIIGFTWRVFFDLMIDENTTDPEVTALFPMVKAAVRAMDTVQNYTSTSLGLTIDNFLVTGYSKRGWTCWLTAAVDDRVIAISPMVLSVLNANENLKKHRRSLDGWSFAFSPYWEMNVTHMIDTPQAFELMRHIDPYTYRDRLTMPKLVVSSSGDEFFLLDDSHLWWDDLPGTNLFMMLENANHFMVGHFDRIVNTISTFYIAVVTGVDLPDVSWNIGYLGSHGRVRLRSDVEPLEVISYHANTTGNTRRDFRLLRQGDDGIEVNPAFWDEGAVDFQGQWTYDAEYPVPEEGQGWSAFFILIRYPGPEGRYYELTSEVCVIPNTFPVEECSQETCNGVIV